MFESRSESPREQSRGDLGVPDSTTGASKAPVTPCNAVSQPTASTAPGSTERPVEAVSEIDATPAAVQAPPSGDAVTPTDSIGIDSVETLPTNVLTDADLESAHLEAIWAATPSPEDAWLGDVADVPDAGTLALMAELAVLLAEQSFDTSIAADDIEATASEQLAWATGLSAGPGLASALGQVDVTALSADEAITLAQQWERVVAHAIACREQARADANAALVAAYAAEDARLAEADRLENAERAAIGLPPIPRRLGAGFVPPELAALNELGAALRMAPRTIDTAIARAGELATPRTATADTAEDAAGAAVVAPWAPLLAAMAAGELTEQHVQAIGRWLRFLPAAGRPTERAAYVEQCARVLEVVIPYAVTHTPGEAGRKTKLLVLTADPAGARERRRKDAENHHCVMLTPTEPGTCELLATMPIAHGEAVMSAINLLAKDARFETAPGCVTNGQRQVAALTTLILGDPGSVGRITGPVTEAKINAHISVIVPLTTITAARRAFGLTTDNTGATTCGSADALPGGRIGTEPVPADLIREVIADAATDSTMRRLVTDSTGTVIDIGRAHYSPTGLQQRLIRMRDGVCRFPGCTRRAEHTEIDHAIAWDAGGLTDLANLGALCKRHHQAKTHGGWTITNSNRQGHCTWRSPMGRIYDHEPEPLVPDPPPAPVDEKPPF